MSEASKRSPSTVTAPPAPALTKVEGGAAGRDARRNHGSEDVGSARTAWAFRPAEPDALRRRSTSPPTTVWACFWVR